EGSAQRAAWHRLTRPYRAVRWRLLKRFPVLRRRYYRRRTRQNSAYLEARRRWEEERRQVRAEIQGPPAGGEEVPAEMTPAPAAAASQSATVVRDERAQPSRSAAPTTRRSLG